MPGDLKAETDSGKINSFKEESDTKEMVAASWSKPGALNHTTAKFGDYTMTQDDYFAESEDRSFSDYMLANETKRAQKYAELFPEFQKKWAGSSLEGMGATEAKHSTEKFLREEYFNEFLLEPRRAEKRAEDEAAAAREAEELAKEQELGNEITRLSGLGKGLRESLSDVTNQAGFAIDDRLNTLLEQSGFMAGQARQDTGEAFSNRGLGRSSFATEAIGDVSLAELGQKGQLKADAQVQKMQVEQQAGNVLKNISDAKVSMITHFKSVEREAFKSQEFQAEVQAAEIEFNAYIADLNIPESTGVLQKLGRTFRGILKEIGDLTGTTEYIDGLFT